MGLSGRFRGRRQGSGGGKGHRKRAGEGEERPRGQERGGKGRKGTREGRRASKQDKNIIISIFLFIFGEKGGGYGSPDTRMQPWAVHP